MIYIVKKGDTLKKIADESNISINDIIDSNPNIANPNLIYIGQEIFIPKIEESSITKEKPKLTSVNEINNTSSENNDKSLENPVEKCSGKGKCSKKIEETTIRISLFFDGTANNRKNTEHREQNTDTYNTWRVPLGKGSYENDHTNISKLERRIKNKSQAEHSIHIYIEGIGTQNDKRDIPEGLSLGTGITGVITKVEKGIKEAITRIDRLGISKKTVIKYIHFDAFGFSRGAAAARYFVYASLTNDKTKIKKTLTSKGYNVSTIKAKFIGLYDTVASYGVAHYNDTSDLHLDAISSAEKVIQLAAAEEHRKNFRLTNINSAGAKGKQIFLPGVHSDVGGGYRDQAEEKDHQILDIDTAWAGDKIKKRFKDEKDWLIDSGWYKSDEIEDVSFFNELVVNRTNINNTYSRIPLQIMANFATETGLSFKMLAVVYPIPDDLKKIKKLIDTHITLGNSTFNDWWDLNSTEIRKLRHNYLHFSSSYGGTNQPQFTNDDKIKGQRRRIIQNG